MSRDKAALSSDRNVNSRRAAAKRKSATDRSISQEGSCSSLASETSSDYAFPPEDGASLRTDSSDVCLEVAAAKSAAAAGSFGSYKKACLVSAFMLINLSLFSVCIVDQCTNLCVFTFV